MARPAETPAQKKERVDRMLVEQRQAAVDALPEIERRARQWVTDAQNMLNTAQANLDHVLNVEIPNANGRPPKGA